MHPGVSYASNQNMKTPLYSQLIPLHPPLPPIPAHHLNNTPPPPPSLPPPQTSPSPAAPPPAP